MTDTATSLELLESLRHRQERRALAAAVAFTLFLLVLLGIVSLGVLLVLLPLVFWLTAALMRVEHRRHLGNAVRVSERQLPEIAQAAAQAAAMLQAPPFEVLVIESPVSNAYAFGWWPPQVVVVTSALVQMLTLEELQFVLGHEVGHIALGHTRVSSLLGGMLGAPGIPLLSFIGGVAFRWWSRLAEYSADRAGLVAVGDLTVAERALTKLMVGSQLASKVNVEEILTQAQDLDEGWAGDAGETAMDHPYLVRRLQALRAFWAENAATIQRLSPMPLQPGPLFGYGDIRPDPSFAWLARIRPALTAAARWSALFFVLAVVTLWAGWASLTVTLVLQVIVGALAAGDAARQGKQLGKSGLWNIGQAVLATWMLLGGVGVLILLLALIAGSESAGTLVPLMVPYFLSLPLIWLITTVFAVLVALGVNFALALRGHPHHSMREV